MEKVLENNGTMVRKAETLVSIDELNLSKRTKAYISNKYGLLEKIIWQGRYDSYYLDNYGSSLKTKAALELVLALDEAGFIRHDLTPAHFAVGKIYYSVFKFQIESDSAWDLLSDNIANMNNAIYETQQAMTGDQIMAVKEALKKCLTPRENMCFVMNVGLETGRPQCFEEIARYLNISRERVRQIVAKATRKLCEHKDWFPPILEFNEMNFRTEALIEDAKGLRGKELERVIADLQCIAETPFTCANIAKHFLEGCVITKLVLSEKCNIERLDLSVRAFNCLIRANIRTIADLRVLTEDELFNIRNLGSKSAKEIIGKMHDAGHNDFLATVDLS